MEGLQIGCHFKGVPQVSVHELIEKFVAHNRGSSASLDYRMPDNPAPNGNNDAQGALRTLHALHKYISGFSDRSSGVPAHPVVRDDLAWTSNRSSETLVDGPALSFRQAVFFVVVVIREREDQSSVGRRDRPWGRLTPESPTTERKKRDRRTCYREPDMKMRNPAVRSR